MLHAQLLTLFPEFFDSPLQCSIPKRAIQAKLLHVDRIQLRDFAHNKHHRVDDRPYGGGPGMVISPEPVVAAIRHARQHDPDTHVILLSPHGQKLTQSKVRDYAKKPGISLVCGRYEGIDARVEAYIDDIVSMGDYVLSGGEPAALSLLDAIIRLLPGALGDAESAAQDSFSEACMLDWPHYTRPAVFEDQHVPEVLLSGDHAKIHAWRLQEAKKRSQNL